MPPMTLSLLAPPIVIETRAGLRQLLADLQRYPAIAVDTESNSLFAYHERVCLIQFSTSATDYIVDALAFSTLSELGDIFADARIEKVFHGADYDVGTLRRDFDFQFAGLFDTMLASRILGIRRFGLNDLLEERFQVRLDKRMQRHDWGRRPLQREALEYARLDTHYLLPLREQLGEELRQRRRENEARAAFARVAQARWSRKAFDPEDFWRIKGALDLDDIGRGILKALYVWRERWAERLDRPPFKVLSDQTLERLARRAPATPRALLETPGLGGLRSEETVGELLRAIAAGRRDPQPLAARPPAIERPDPVVMERYERLRQWRKAQAAARDVEPDVLISNNALLEIARRAPATAEELLAIAAVSAYPCETFAEEMLAALWDAAPAPKPAAAPTKVSAD